MCTERTKSFWLAVVTAGLVSVGGCAVSESLDLPDASSSGASSGGAVGAPSVAVGGSAGGSSGGAGAGLPSGAGGTTGAAGSTAPAGLGGTVGQVGAGGNQGAGMGGSAGRAGVAGRTGATVGAAGRGGAGGAPAAGGASGQSGKAGGSGSPDGSTAPTFTEIYKNILLVYCSGSGCHDPGVSGGLGFATQASAFAALSHQVRPGDGVDSDLYVTLDTGVMPKGKPKLSAANIALIKDWIDAGALDD